ncbi:hypothetical protein [Janthinobacterium aquaticum]|uniref:hypothetical protein n=1 Tax=Janthinobacterium sp. FT58W TaxID=2654254 RepID=UPI0012648089|nr:hypothetical protein [Janthinobacterium sp. FT58W]KAB8042583.1 hypothetical protein GCM43_13755 [Janthinobacterium sp. FT58W]
MAGRISSRRIDTLRFERISGKQRGRRQHQQGVQKLDTLTPTLQRILERKRTVALAWGEYLADVAHPADRAPPRDDGSKVSRPRLKSGVAPVPATPTRRQATTSKPVLEKAMRDAGQPDEIRRLADDKQCGANWRKTGKIPELHEHKPAGRNSYAWPGGMQQHEQCQSLG